jgi:outer membrane immunogenic protein
MVKIPASLALIVIGTSIASAADLPTVPPIAPLSAPSFFSFTGFYVGGNLGGAWTQANTSDTIFALNFERNGNGVFIGGGQAGFNYQFGYALVGIEGDFDWIAKNNSDDNILIGPLGNSLQLTSDNKWISTLAARFGFVLESSLLVYGKAGAGWVGNNGFTLTDLTTGQSFTGLNSSTSTGWLGGVGFEWAFAPSWTVKLEYDYLGINSRTFTVNGAALPALTGDTFAVANRNVQMGKVGVNYLFNGARY